MPIIRVEVCGADEQSLSEGLAAKIQDAFAEIFVSNKKHVDVRVAAAAHAHFAGFYEQNDEPVWVDVLMRELPALPERKGKILAFSTALAKLFSRDPSTIVLHLQAAPKDRLAFGGKLLMDLEKESKTKK